MLDLRGLRSIENRSTKSGQSHTALIVDKAGNDSTPAHITLTKDITAPEVTIAASPTISNANQAAYLLNGTCTEEGRVITLSGSLNVTAPCAAGLWSVSHNFTATPDGSVIVNATQDDAAGNLSASATRTLLKSTGIPVVTIDALSLSLANQSTGPITGTCSVPGQSVIIGGDASATVLCVGGIYSANFNFSSLPDGNIDLTADHSDGIGNDAVQATRTIAKDATAPVFTSLVGANAAANGYVNSNEISSSAAMFTLNASGFDTASYSSILNDNPSVTCDASKTYNQSSIPTIDMISSADASYVVCVKLSDAAGNVTYGKSQAIVRDTVAPTVNVGLDIVANASAGIDASTTDASTFSWTQVSGPGTMTFGSDNAEDTSVSADMDGTYVLRLTITDVAGNTASDELTLEWDTAAPTFNAMAAAHEASDGYLNASELSSTEPMWTLDASDYTTARFSTPLDNSISITCNTSITYNQMAIPVISGTPSSDKPYVICVRLEDIAGNITYGKSAVIIRDATPPTVDVGSDVTVNSAYSADATTSGGATFTWTKVSGPGLISFGNANAEDTTITADMDGIYVIRLTVTDTAGNTAADDLTMTWNTTGPGFISLAGAHEASDGYINGTETASNQAMFTLNASNFTSVSYTAILDNATSPVCDSSKTYGASSIPLISALPAVDKSYVICVKLEDGASNVVYGKSMVITRDTVPPTVNVGSDVQAKTIHSLNTTVSGAFTYAWTKESGPGAITFGSANAKDTTVSADTDGTYVLRLTVTDAAGNSAFDELNFTWDTVAPTFTSLLGAHEASDGYINNSEKASTNAMVALTASGYSLAEYSVILDDTPSITCDGSKTYSNTSVPTINTMSATDDTYAVCVRLTDTAGNITYGKSSSIVRDTVAPEFIFLVGAYEAAYGYINESETASTSPIVVLEAAFYTSATYTAILDNTPAITCDESKTYSNSSAPLINTMPAVDDTYVICVKLADAAGNITYGTSAVITRDTVAPVFTSLLGANQAHDGYINANEIASTSAIVNLTASGYKNVYYTTVLNNTPSITCDASKSYSSTAPPAINATPSVDDSYAVCVRIQGAAGNTIYGKSSTIIRDIVPPTVNVGSDVKKGAMFTINATTSGASTFAWTKVSGPGTITFGSASAEDTTVFATADGAYVLRLTATDTAGNYTQDDMNLTWDTIPPVFGALPVANQAADGYINANDASSTGDFAVLVASSGYETAEYTAILDDTPSITCDNSKTYSNSSAPAINTMPASDDSYALCVRLTDDAGNITYGKSPTVVRDTVAPVFTSLPLANQAADGVINNLDIAANNPLTTAVNGSGYTIFYYKATLSVTACSAETYTIVSIPTAGSLTAGTRKVCVRLRDAAGNTTYGSSNDFVVDTTNPIVDVGFDQARISLFVLTPSVSGASTYQWSVTEGTAANISFGTATSASTTVSASAPGEYKLRLTATSSTGNTAYDEMYLYWMPTSGAHTAFVTYNTHHGNFSNLAGADAFCNSDAALGGLSGNYKALLSTSTVNAKTRVSTPYPILRRDGIVVADNSTDMWDGSIDNAIVVNTIGNAVIDQRPWTGSNNLGVYSGRNCSDWRTNQSNFIADQGYATARQEYWFGEGYDYFCHTFQPLYCISESGEAPIHFTGTASKIGSAVDITFVIPSAIVGSIGNVELRRATGSTAPDCTSGTLVHTWSGDNVPSRKLRRTDVGSPSTTYSYTVCIKSGSTVIRSYALPSVTSSPAKHVIFVTFQQYPPGSLGGLTGADAKCQARADAVQLGGTFKAVLSSDTVNVKDRLTISGPIYNMAGQLVANNAADLWDGSIANAVIYAETNYAWSPLVVTGSTAAGLKTANTCSGWTSTSGDPTYGYGMESDSKWIFSGDSSITCTTNNVSLYCISQ